MPNHITSAPNPGRFADVWVKEVLAPAVEKLAGADGKLTRAELQGTLLQGASALAQDDLMELFEAAGGQEAGVDALLKAGRQYALAHATQAAGADGRLSIPDAGSLPMELQADFRFLRTGEGVAAELDTHGYRMSTRVLQDVVERYGITDTQALVDTAITRSSNKVLSRAELEAAATDLATPSPTPGPAPTPTPQPDALDAFRWAPSTVARVMTSFGLGDQDALLREATSHDDGNKYLKRSELEAAAKVLTQQVPDVELGIISDLDKTIIPKHGTNDPMPTPYPGIKAILHELEFGNGGQAGDITYVTARGPDRVVDVPDYLETHGLPSGPIETGTSSMPWVAEPEKIKDASKAFDAHPDQSFVLLGDSSHRDPEVYKALIAKYPGRVKIGFIHKVNNTVSPDRVKGLHLIENYAEAAAIMFREGVVDEAAARRIMVSAQVEGLDITDAEIDSLIDEYRP